MMVMIMALVADSGKSGEMDGAASQRAETGRRSSLKPLRLLGWVMDEGDEANMVNAKLSELFGRKLLEGVVWVSRGHERPPFRIPEQLREAWNVRSREQQL